MNDAEGKSEVQSNDESEKSDASSNNEEEGSNYSKNGETSREDSDPEEDPDFPGLSMIK